MSRMRERQKATLTLACAPIEDGLDDAKTAHAEARTAESRAARTAAMTTMHQTRAWLRAKDELATLPQTIAGLEAQLGSARLAKDDEAAERVAKLGRKLAAATARQSRIQARFGPLVQAMEQLAAEQLAAAGGEG